MPSTSLRSLIFVFLPSILFTLIYSRHIENHDRLHRSHNARQLIHEQLTTMTMTEESIPTMTPTMTEGSAVIGNINNIQSGLFNLFPNLSKFLASVTQRIQELEASISSLLLSPIQTPSPESFTSLTSIPIITPSPRPTSLCRPPAGAGPLVPCPPIGIPFPFTNRTDMAPGTGIASSCFPIPPMVTGGTAGATIPTPTAVPTTSSPEPPMYTFNADAPDNVAVYYGQASDTQAGGLLALCQDVNVDIAILAFVFDFFAPNGYPSINFGSACGPPNPPQAEIAPGLADCTALASEVAGCQQLGKKVLVSLGGYTANSNFASTIEAQTFAATIWGLFGRGTGIEAGLRPFGPDVVVDGFDIDNENHDSSYYDTFAYALREEFAQDSTKAYYLSAAPQCPMPDESIPMGAMLAADFVFVQFYNNPQCNLDSEGFQASFKTWSEALSEGSRERGKPRVYIGAEAFDGAGSGYIPGSGLSSAVSLAQELYVENLGGIMLWDGSRGLANLDESGVNYIEYAKSALEL